MGIATDTPETTQQVTSLALDSYPLYVMNRLVNRLNINLQTLLKEELDLELHEWRVLAVVANHRTVNISALSTYTVTRQSTISKATKRMVENGLIFKDPVPENRRTIQVRLTDQGRARYEAALPLVLSHYEKALKGIDKDAIKQFQDVLARMWSNVARNPLLPPEDR